MFDYALIGMITGIVGTVTGIAGAVLGYIGYRRSVKVRSLDLRMRLRKELVEVRALVATLPAQLVGAGQSRAAVMSAHGMTGSGAMVRWNQELDVDRQIVEALIVPSSDQHLVGLSESELETQLIELHALRLKAEAVRNKYLEAGVADEKARDKLRSQLGR